MFCIRCGTRLPDEAAFCPSCGTPVTIAPEAPGSSVPLVADASGPLAGAADGSAATLARPKHAGFWRRVAGHVIDRFVLGVVFTPVGFMVLVPLMATQSSGWTDTDLPAETMAAFLGAMLTVAFLAMLGNWLYCALLQSSTRQATLGQMALGLRVTDVDGRRVSFARASGRHFATVLTGLTFGIGYLMVVFTARKQTLHDLIAGTLVVR